MKDQRTPDPKIVDDLVVLATTCPEWDVESPWTPPPQMATLERVIVDRKNAELNAALNHLQQEGLYEARVELECLTNIIVDSPWKPQSQPELSSGFLCQTVAFPVITSDPRFASDLDRAVCLSLSQQNAWKAWLSGLSLEQYAPRVYWNFDARLHPGDHLRMIESSSLLYWQRAIGDHLLPGDDSRDFYPLPSDVFPEVSPKPGDPSLFLLLGVVALPFDAPLDEWRAALNEFLFSEAISRCSSDATLAALLNVAFDTSHLKLMRLGTVTQALYSGSRACRDVAFLERVLLLQRKLGHPGSSYRALVAPAVDSADVVRALHISLLDEAGTHFIGGASFDRLTDEEPEEALKALQHCCRLLNITYLANRHPVSFESQDPAVAFPQPDSMPDRRN